MDSIFENWTTVGEPLLKRPFKRGEFCVHELSTDESDDNLIVLLCQWPKITIKKCCPHGYAVDRHSIDRCVANEARFVAEHFIEPFRLANYEVVSNSPIRCQFDYNIYLPQLYIDNEIQVRASGLFVERAQYAIIRESSDYCVDSTVDDDGTLQVSSNWL